MDHDILAAMRWQAGSCYDDWISKAQRIKARVSDNRVFGRQRPGRLSGSWMMRLHFFMAFVRVALAMLCFFGAGAIFRAYFTGYRPLEDEAQMMIAHRVALAGLGLFLLASAFYRFKALWGERRKDAVSRGADRLIAALQKKKEALSVPDAAGYAAAARTDLQVCVEMDKLEDACQVLGISLGTNDAGRNRRRDEPPELLDEDAIVPLFVLFWVSLVVFTLAEGLIIVTTVLATANMPIIYMLLSLLLSLLLAFLCAAYRHTAVLAFNLIPFSGVLIALLAAYALGPLLSLLAMLLSGYLLYLAIMYRVTR